MSEPRSADVAEPGAGAGFEETGGVPLDQVLRTPVLSGSRVLAGAQGLSRPVTRLNVMEVPDIQPWVRPGELLLTVGYPVRDDPDSLGELVEGLHARGVTALAIKLGRYLDAVPDSVLAIADRLGFPVVSLPAHVSFDDVLTDVLGELVNRQAKALARAERVHRRLVDVVLTGGSMVDVAESLSDVLPAVVVVTTPDGREIASAGPDDLQRVVRGQPCFDTTGRLRTEDQCAALGLHAAEPGAGTSPLVSTAVATVSAGALEHGRIAAFGVGRELGPDDLHALQRAATVCALVVTRDLAVAAVEDKYRTDYLRDLLLGRAGRPEDAVAHARAFGWDVSRPLVVVVLEPDPAPLEPDAAEVDAARRPTVDRQAAALAGALRAREGQAAVAGLRTETVALVGVPSDGDVRRTVRELVAIVRGEGGGGRRAFGVGVSRVCEGVDQIPFGYEQARTAVRVGRQVHGESSLTHFDELGVYRLLSLVSDEGELRSFAAETLGELAGTDPEAEDLRRTLEVLLETNINVAETARRLHFHYNTLRYRIGKLERLLGPFTSESTLRLDLSLALKVVAMRGLSNSA